MQYQSTWRCTYVLFLLMLLAGMYGYILNFPPARAQSHLPAQNIFTFTSAAINIADGKCLSGYTNMIEIVSQHICTGGLSQQWIFSAANVNTFTLINVSGGKCLDVAGSSTADGASIIQSFCNHSFSQWWRPTITSLHYFQLKNLFSHKCLDIANRLFNDGATVIQATCSASNYQKWSLPSSQQNPHVRPSLQSLQSLPQPLTSLTNIVQDDGSGKCLGILEFTVHGMETVSQYTCDTSSLNQGWALVTVLPHTIVLINAHSKKCLSVAGSSRGNGAAIIQYVCSYADSQLWQLFSIGQNHYHLENVVSSKCLDIANRSFDDGAAAILSVCGTAASQNWTLSKFQANVQATATPPPITPVQATVTPIFENNVQATATPAPVAPIQATFTSIPTKNVQVTVTPTPTKNVQ